MPRTSKCQDDLFEKQKVRLRTPEGGVQYDVWVAKGTILGYYPLSFRNTQTGKSTIYYLVTDTKQGKALSYCRRPGYDYLERRGCYAFTREDQVRRAVLTIKDNTQIYSSLETQEKPTNELADQVWHIFKECGAVFFEAGPYHPPPVS